MKTIFALLILMSTAAHAYSSYSSSSGDTFFRFGLSGMRDDHTTSYANQTSTDLQTNHINTRFDYTWSNGFYLGALYEYSSYVSGTGQPTPDKRVSYGPSVGYFSSGFYVEATYFMSSTYTFASGTYLSSGSNYQIELGYVMNLTSSFYMGLSLVSGNYSWNQTTTSSVTTSQTNGQTDIYPCVALGFIF